MISRRREVPMPEFLAELPYALGFRLGDEDVVMIALGEHGNVIVQAVVEWADVRATLELRGSAEVSNADIALALTDSVVASTATASPHRFAVIGYGPRGRDRAALIAKALQQLAYSPPAEPIQIHVDGGAVSLLQPDLQEWSYSQPLPDVSAEAVLAGIVSPVRSRADVAALYAPTSSPLFAPIPADAAALLATQPPSFRAQIATRTLSTLATPGHGDDPERMATLAHLVTEAPMAVRDAVMVQAAHDTGQVDVLIRCYQGAPEPLRGALATVAGSAAFMAGRPAPAVRAVLSYGDQDGPHARLITLTQEALKAGLNPHRLRAAITETFDGELVAADRRWSSQRTAAMQRSGHSQVSAQREAVTVPPGRSSAQRSEPDR